MQNVTVKRLEILERIKTNREAHRTIVEEALVGYRAAVIEELDRMIADAKSGRKIRRAVSLVEPQDHTRDYDNVIDMLESSVDDFITLDAHSFRQYVRDEWVWRDQFLKANKLYSNTAFMADGGDLG